MAETIQVARFDPSFAAWRKTARQFLASETPPEQILWQDSRDKSTPPLFGVGPESEAAAPPPASNAARIPKRFIELAELVACHRDPSRWPLLYRALWRLTHGEASLMQIAVDADVVDLNERAKAVSRDRHKMTAFVRFRKVIDDAGEHYIAFHRPDHFIVRLTSPFFVQRFGSMRWTILTPDETANYEDGKLVFGPGVSSRDAPADDELESLWLTYYRNIFNPARIKLDAMKSELPVRHWKTLPETRIIPEMLAEAPERVRRMTALQGDIDRPAITVNDRIAPVEAVKHATRGKDQSTLKLPVVPESDSMEMIRVAAATCLACEWAERSTQTVFGEGPHDARLMIVGEQPGDSEDLQGRPFIGPAGQLLQDIFEEVGLDRSGVYVTNAVKHFKFEMRGKRRIHQTPTARDVGVCKPWLEAELKVVKPKVLMALGATAARAMFGNGFRITQQRGDVFKTDYAPSCLASFHPSAILRVPDPDGARQMRADLQADLTTAMKLLDR